MNVTEPELPQHILRQIEQCKTKLADIGVVLRGSVTERFMPCGKRGCRCQATPRRSCMGRTISGRRR